MKKNVLIVTLFDNNNYGNRFQNYAMQQVLAKLDTKVCTSINASTQHENRTILTRIKRITLKKIITIISIIIKNLINKKRITIFNEFSNKYIEQFSWKSYEEINEKFEVICVGSDQIWNPHFMNNFYYSFGEFSENVFSYAASFGIAKIPDNYKEKIKKGLEKIKKISVREDKGADIVEELTGVRPEVLVDPTILLTNKEWDKIIKEPKKMPDKKFVLTYFLGSYSRKRRKYIKKLAKENNFEIVDLGQVRNWKYYNMGPSEFLYFIKNCELVLTDSFHGSVFSILYKKPFYIFNREEKVESMNSRIETLLNKFKLTGREVKDYSQKLEFNCDFSRVDQILDDERKKSMEFLKKAIESK